MRLEFCPRGWDFGFKAGILTSRLGFGPRDWDLDLEAGIWTSWLGFGPRGWDLVLEVGGGYEEEEGEEGEGKISAYVKA